MNKTGIRVLGVLLVIAPSIVPGCSLIADFDESKIPGDGGLLVPGNVTYDVIRTFNINGTGSVTESAAIPYAEIENSITANYAAAKDAQDLNVQISSMDLDWTLGAGNLAQSADVTVTSSFGNLSGAEHINLTGTVQGAKAISLADGAGMGALRNDLNTKLFKTPTGPPPTIGVKVTTQGGRFVGSVTVTVHVQISFTTCVGRQSGGIVDSGLKTCILK
ncbi:MAG: hypothetical protein ABIS27_12910 [Longimicrobiales bacterium]